MCFAVWSPDRILTLSLPLLLSADLPLPQSAHGVGLSEIQERKLEDALKYDKKNNWDHYFEWRTVGSFGSRSS